MCNFYMMYWVDGDHLLENDVCASPGPPNYYFGHDQVYLFILFFNVFSLIHSLEFECGKNS